MRRLFCFALILCCCPFVDAVSPPVTKARPAPPSLEIAALQLALDNAGFSPGIIDGRDGAKTTIAVQWARDAEQAVEMPDKPWREWKIPEHFLEEVAQVPKSWLERSQTTGMWHETNLERISETFHVSRAFLVFLNPGIRDWTAVQEGDSLHVPAIDPRKLPRADHVRIFLSRKIIVAYGDDEKILAAFPCSIAAKKEKRPIGVLQVCNFAPHPDYVFDPTLFEDPEARTLKSKLIIPPGPNNPVGDMWIGLNLKGYGIHGTPNPEDIGKTESHGCFRLTNWDVVRLANMLKIGTPVSVEP